MPTERYEMVKKLGQGTYGSVFLCVQRDTGRQCVMKRMALSARQHQVLAEESAVLHGGWLWWIDGSHTIDEAHAPTAPRESPCRGLSPHVDFFSPLYPVILFGNHPQDFPARLSRATCGLPLVCEYKSEGRMQRRVFRSIHSRCYGASPRRSARTHGGRCVLTRRTASHTLFPICRTPFPPHFRNGFIFRRSFFERSLTRIL